MAARHRVPACWVGMSRRTAKRDDEYGIKIEINGNVKSNGSVNLNLSVNSTTGSPSSTMSSTVTEIQRETPENREEVADIHRKRAAEEDHLPGVVKRAKVEEAVNQPPRSRHTGCQEDARSRSGPRNDCPSLTDANFGTVNGSPNEAPEEKYQEEFKEVVNAAKNCFYETLKQKLKPVPMAQDVKQKALDFCADIFEKIVMTYEKACQTAESFFSNVYTTVSSFLAGFLDSNGVGPAMRRLVVTLAENCCQYAGEYILSWIK